MSHSRPPLLPTTMSIVTIRVRHRTTPSYFHLIRNSTSTFSTTQPNSQMSTSSASLSIALLLSLKVLPISHTLFRPPIKLTLPPRSRMETHIRLFPIPRVPRPRTRRLSRRSNPTRHKLVRIRRCTTRPFKNPARRCSGRRCSHPHRQLQRPGIRSGWVLSEHGV